MATLKVNNTAANLRGHITAAHGAADRLLATLSALEARIEWINTRLKNLEWKVEGHSPEDRPRKRRV